MKIFMVDALDWGIIYILTEYIIVLLIKCIKYIVPRLINGLNTNIYDKLYTHSFDGFVQFIKRFFLSRIILKIVPLSTVMYVKLFRWCCSDLLLFIFSYYLYVCVYMYIYICMCICVCISLLLSFVNLIHSFSCAVISEIILITACLLIISFIIF